MDNTRCKRVLVLYHEKVLNARSFGHCIVKLKVLLKRIEHETSGIIWIRHDVVLWCFTKFYCLPWQRSYICFADRKEICSVGFRNHSGQILLRSMRFNRPVLLPLGMMPSVFIRMIRLGKPWPISWFAISQPGWGPGKGLVMERSIMKIIPIGFCNSGSLGNRAGCINCQNMYPPQ